LVEVVLTIVLLGGGALVFAALVLALSSTTRQRREMIVAAMKELDATDVRSRNLGLHGVVRGVPVRWDVLGGGRGNPVHTMCSVSLVQPPRFLMELRRQTGEELEQVRAGRAVDVVVGDQRFDDAFIVEAAPSDVAKKLLDGETRRMLLAMQPLRLCVAKDTLWLDVVGVVGHVAIAKSMLELVLSLSRRLGEMPRAIAEERMAADSRDAGGAAYRGTTPGTAGAIDAWSPQAEKEIAALLLARKRREQRTWVTVGIGIAVWLGFSLATMRCAQR
jgi:hypothetical protein